MSNKIFALLVILAIVLFAPPVLASGGTKIISNVELEISAVVPELAPEFLGWSGTLIASRKYSNGNSLYMVAFDSPDKRAGVLSIIAHIGDKLFLIEFAAFYEERGETKPDLYEDTGFAKNGTPSGIMIQIQNPLTLEAIEEKISAVGV